MMKCPDCQGSDLRAQGRTFVSEGYICGRFVCCNCGLTAFHKIARSSEKLRIYNNTAVHPIR